MLEDFVKEFLLECQEGLSQIESQLVVLEDEPSSVAVLSSIFRVVHSIKGASGFLGFSQMAAVSHEGEELLGKLREGELQPSPSIVSGLLAMADAMRSMIASIETTHQEGDRDDSALVMRLRALQSGRADDLATDVSRSLEPSDEPPPIAATRPGDAGPAAQIDVSKNGGQGPDGVEAVAPPESSPASEGAIGQPSILGESTIRVDVALLDKLMNLVGELVLTRNQMLLCSLVRDEAMFQASSHKLNLITTELQSGMMKTRMQPIRNLSSKLPRVVRDLSLACGKTAKIVMEGEDTELDRTLSEAVKDPITHIIRNAIDHGIEAAERRISRGKPAEGTIRLRAYHEGGMVNIEVSDDGNGIDPDKIRRKALERGWLTEDQANRWSDHELLGLIFRPGFSTAESLTMVSGRGVGMDVVKSRIESIGGRVDASSRVGVGTTIKMKIPLTLTIVNALIVCAGGDRFAIPQVNLVELIRLDGDAVKTGLVEVQGTRVGRYRGRLLPLIDLNQVLRIRPDDERRDHDSVSIVVLQADQHHFGLIVDRIDDAREIVVRPLARQLRGIGCLAGATIMGDGKIALILDVFGLSKGLDGSQPMQNDAAADATAVAEEDGLRKLLLLRGTDGSPFAIELAEVDRLETFASTSVEWIAGSPLVQYRETLLPLIDVSSWVNGGRWLADPTANWTCQVVIHIHQGRRVGLVFEKVVDLVSERLNVRGEASRRGVKLTAAIQGRATEMLDLTIIRDDYVARFSVPSLRS